MYMPRVWAEIDLDALTHNFQYVRQRLRPKTKIAAVVKADAYGHGALRIAQSLLAAGADMFGVGDSTEAIELREGGIQAPIIVLGALVDREIDKVIRHEIIPTIHSLDRVRQLDECARNRGTVLPVHIMVDTGMSRLGVKPSSALPLIMEIKNRSHLRLQGICTHFAAATLEDPAFTLHQLALFRDILAKAEAARIPIPLVHAANSAAMFTIENSHFAMVRPGVALYGLDPGNFSRCGVAVRPVLSLKSQIVFLKDVEKGTPIGYCNTHTAPLATRIATIPIGYNDGYPFGLSNRAEVLIRGKRCSLVGTVTMDYIMVDVGHVPGVHVGDEVTLIGCQGTEEIRAETLAMHCNIIPYVVTCLLGKRVRRTYLSRSGQEEADTAASRVAFRKNADLRHLRSISRGSGAAAPCQPA
jgi:alanine racemase